MLLNRALRLGLTVVLFCGLCGGKLNAQLASQRFDSVVGAAPRMTAPLFPPQTIREHVVLGALTGAAVTAVSLAIAYAYHESIHGYTGHPERGMAAVLLLPVGTVAGGLLGLVVGVVRN